MASQTGACTQAGYHGYNEHSIGLKGLVGKRFDQDEKCPSCVLRKSTLENYPELREPATHPLSRVNMDLYTSSVISIEGYNHAVVFTDSHGEYRWQYSLKTKDEVLPTSK